MTTWAERQKKPAKGHKDYTPDETGLKLRVFSSGTRYWYIRGRIKRASGEGEPRYVILGSPPVMTREQASAEAANVRMQLRQGIDPNAARDAKLRAADAARKTFKDVAEEWSQERIGVGKWSDATIAARRNVFNGPRLAPLRDRPIGAITTREIEAVAAEVHRNSKQATLGPVRSVFRYALERGYVAKSPFTREIEITKAQGDAAPLIEFHEGRAPDFSELVATLDSIDAAERRMPLSPWWAIWRVCMLTGQRPSAVIGMRRSELKLEGDAPTWSLPAARSKIKRDSVIPLSKDCAAILREIPRGKDSDLVWPGRDGKNERRYPPVEPQLVSALLAERGFPRGWWPGRARDSVASWLEFQNDATERALALLLGHHQPKDNTRRRHYARISAEHQARVLIERWAAAVRDARSGKKQRVVALRRS